MKKFTKEFLVSLVYHTCPSVGGNKKTCPHRMREAFRAGFL
jgi:hypothetical protein